MHNDIDIRHIKLVSGEEIIATVIESGDTGSEYSLILARPIKIHFSINPEGDAFSMFSRWNMFSDLNEPCFLNPEHVISFSFCSESTIEKYLLIVNGEDSDEDKLQINDSVDQENSEFDMEKYKAKGKIVIH